MGLSPDECCTGRNNSMSEQQAQLIASQVASSYSRSHNQFTGTYPPREVKVNLHRNIVRMFSEVEDDASGTSAVAIDNKIEQAMDLVKSHLMIAVREEVEVLKEKIAELMDRINQLELENTILKANVSQETLSQLSQTMQTTTTKAPQNTNTSNGPVS